MWGRSCQEAFEWLNEILTAQPVFKVADPEWLFILQTDASEYGLGAVLSQEDENGDKHPVAFASWKFIPHEVNYSIIKKECLAVVWTLTYFHMYLEGHHFMV